MSDCVLKAEAPLNEVLSIGKLSLVPVNSMALYSLSYSLDDQNAVSQQLEKAFSLRLPAITASTQNNEGTVRCLGLQREQVLLLLHSDETSEQSIRDSMNDQVYVTDQSDSWVILRVSGDDSREALARICPLDLHESVFTDGMVARTSMEHLSVIVIRDRADFLLLSPSSSAQSFLHAVEVSARHVSDDRLLNK